MINVEKRRAIVAHCRALCGTPWVHQGRLPVLGLDCIGVAIEATKAAGEWTPEVAAQVPDNYGRIPHNNNFYKFLNRVMSPIAEKDKLIGDLALICWRSYTMHIGVLSDKLRDGSVTGPFSLIHALANFKRVDEQIFDPKFMVVHGYYRFPGLAAEEAA